MFAVLRIPTIEGSELQRGWFFNMNLWHAIDVKNWILHFPKSKLPARGIEDTVLAIPYENRTCASANKYSAVFHLIYLNLLTVIHDYKSAVFAVSNVKHLTIDLSWFLNKRFSQIIHIFVTVKRCHHVVSPFRSSAEFLAIWAFENLRFDRHRNRYCTFAMDAVSVSAESMKISYSIWKMSEVRASCALCSYSSLWSSFGFALS